ncbi:MAG: flippase-like domain-containing protein [Planctomycetaceae bacterium]|nr:flippase-like domain-containing protein [Planctomycetaceae bacterium]
MSKRTAKLALKVGVTLAAVLWIGLKVNWGAIGSAFARIPFSTWALVWGGFLAGHALGIFKWRYNVNLGMGEGRARLRPLDAVQCYSAGMFANLCLPSIVGGDALKAVLAARVTGRAEAAVLGGLTERLIDTLALLVLIVAGALWSKGTMPNWAQSVVQVGAVLAIGGALLALPLVLRTKLARWPKKLRRTAGRSMVALRRVLVRPHRALVVFALSLVIQAWFVLLNRELGIAIGVEAPLAVWFFCVPMTKAITLAPLSVGGLGLREATLAGFLFAMAAVPEVDGVASSLLWQSILIATGLVGGALWFVLGLRAEARTGGGRDSLFKLNGSPSRG